MAASNATANKKFYVSPYSKMVTGNFSKNAELPQLKLKHFHEDHLPFHEKSWETIPRTNITMESNIHHTYQTKNIIGVQEAADQILKRSNSKLLQNRKHVVMKNPNLIIKQLDDHSPSSPASSAQKQRQHV